jgi:hypothetical protein
VLGGRAAQPAGALVAPGFCPADTGGRRAGSSGVRSSARTPCPRCRRFLGGWADRNDRGRGRGERVATPVVVCGRNEELRRRLAKSGVRYALGWVDDMPAPDAGRRCAGRERRWPDGAGGHGIRTSGATYRPISRPWRVERAACVPGRSQHVDPPSRCPRPPALSSSWTPTAVASGRRPRSCSATTTPASCVAKIADQVRPSVHTRRTSHRAARGRDRAVASPSVPGSPWPSAPLDYLARRNGHRRG